MFVPLRYKLDVGLAPRVRVSQAQLTAVPGLRFGARNLSVARAKPEVALTGTRLKVRQDDTSPP
jgi:hypothetical protein